MVFDRGMTTKLNSDQKKIVFDRGWKPLSLFIFFSRCFAIIHLKRKWQTKLSQQILTNYLTPCPASVQESYKIMKRSLTEQSLDEQKERIDLLLLAQARANHQQQLQGDSLFEFPENSSLSLSLSLSLLQLFLVLENCAICVELGLR